MRGEVEAQYIISLVLRPDGNERPNTAEALQFVANPSKPENGRYEKSEQKFEFVSFATTLHNFALQRH